FIVTASVKVSVRHPVLNHRDMRIKRAQAQCAIKALYRCIRFTDPGLDPAAEPPCRREVWIERERPINKSHTSVEVATEGGQCNPAGCKGDCVVLAQLDGPPGQPHAFDNLTFWVDPPTMSPAH